MEEAKRENERKDRAAESRVQTEDVLRPYRISLMHAAHGLHQRLTDMNNNTIDPTDATYKGEIMFLLARFIHWLFYYRQHSKLTKHYEFIGGKAFDYIHALQTTQNGISKTLANVELKTNQNDLDPFYISALGQQAIAETMRTDSGDCVSYIKFMSAMSSVEGTSEDEFVSNMKKWIYEPLNPQFELFSKINEQPTRFIQLDTLLSELISTLDQSKKYYGGKSVDVKNDAREGWWVGIEVNEMQTEIINK